MIQDPFVAAHSASDHAGCIMDMNCLSVGEQRLAAKRNSEEIMINDELISNYILYLARR